MLGRLRMALEECRAAYEELSETAFTPLHSSLNLPMVGWKLWSAAPTFDVKKLEDAILAVLAKNEIIGNTPENALFNEPESVEGTTRPCKTYASKPRGRNNSTLTYHSFVVCTDQKVTETIIFRSYPNRERITKGANKKCTILQACHATSAAPVHGWRFPDTVGVYLDSSG
jgi:hypothetical protein